MLSITSPCRLPIKSRGHRTAALLAASALTLAPFPAAGQDALPQGENEYYRNAQTLLEERLARQPNTSRARNVILLVADGNGVGTNYATRLFAGQQAGNHGDEHVLPHETFPYLALAKTYNTNAQTPDSSGTATAFMSGVKTKAGVTGVTAEVVRGDCATVEGNIVPSIAQILAGENKAIGLVTTARVTHATPSSVYAHSADRNFEDNSALPEGCTQKDIAVQMIEAMQAGNLDVAMGGGRRHFLPAEATDDEGKNGRRTDGRNLVEEARSAGATYVWNDETAAGLDPSKSGPVLALFESSHMKYEHDRTGEPSLAEMTEMAIKKLQAEGGENGFFLQVEAGRVDHANHGGNLHRTLTDGVAFANAVAKADELTDDADTLIIVTADHEHAIAFNGYCGRGTPITGLCYKVDPAGTKHLDEPNTADDGRTYTVVGFLNGPGTILKKVEDDTDMGAEAGGAAAGKAAQPQTKLSDEPQAAYNGTRPPLTQAEATDPDYLQQALIPSSSETHSGEDVAIYAKGPWAHLIDGTVEQNYIFNVMRHATRNGE